MESANHTNRISNIGRVLSIAAAALLYLIASTLILRIHQLSPTNMAGPGLDLVVYFFAVITAIVILAKNIGKTTRAKTFNGFRFVNIAGALAMLALTYRMLIR